MKRIVEDLRRRGIKGYTIYKLDNAFPFYLLDLNKLNISLPCAHCFQYITIEPCRLVYNVVFYDEVGVFAAHIKFGFAEEKSATKYFNELLLNIFQEMKKGECNG